MPDPDVHTELCAGIHVLLTKSSDDFHQAPAKSRTRAMLRVVIKGLIDAEVAAHQMCPVPDPREGSPS